MSTLLKVYLVKGRNILHAQINHKFVSESIQLVASHLEVSQLRAAVLPPVTAVGSLKTTAGL